MQSDALARERRPLASSPGGGRHSPPKAGGGKDPEFRAVRPSAGTPAFSVIRTGAWYTPFAALCAAVPGSTGRTAQRSAFPCLRAIRSVGGPARRHESAVPGCVHVSAARHHEERRAGKGTPTSGQFSRWGPAQPAAGGRREGPRVQGRFASRPEPRRSASSGRVRGTRLLLRFAQRCWAPPGELPRGPAFPCLRAIRSVGGLRAGMKVPGLCARLGRTPPCRATRWQGADLRSAQPAEGGRREGPEFRGGSPLGRNPGVQRHPDGCVVHAAALRQRCRAPPGELPRGRRSRPARHRSVGGPARRHESAVPGWCSLGRTPPCRATRWQGTADLRSAVQERFASPGTPALSVIRAGAWHTPFAAPKQRCRAPPGELRRGRTFPCLRAIRSVGGPARRHESAVPGWCTSRPHATMQSDALARERRPPVGTARRRRAAGRTPSSGRFAPRPEPGPPGCRARKGAPVFRPAQPAAGGRQGRPRSSEVSFPVSVLWIK